MRALGAFLDLQHAWVIFSSDQQLPASAVVWRTNDNGQTWTASAPREHEVFGQYVWAEFAAWVRTSNGGAAWIEIQPAIG